MNPFAQKALMSLITQIKGSLTAIEDIVIDSRCDLGESSVTKKPPPKPQPKPELQDDEEDLLEKTLENERLSMLQVDATLQDLWARAQNKDSDK